MLTRSALCLLLLLLLCCAAVAQNSSSQTPVSGADSSQPRTESSIMIGSPVAEMLARREIKYAEKERQENLERAREAAQLGAEIHNSYTKNRTLSRTEIKKIERLEKLTRRIREKAGGSDGEVMIENPPREMEAALLRMAELAETLRKGVEKTPRQVISAYVIERTNELLEIIRYVRSMTH